MPTITAGRCNSAAVYVDRAASAGDSITFTISTGFAIAADACATAISFITVTAFCSKCARSGPLCVDVKRCICGCDTRACRQRRAVTENKVYCAVDGENGYLYTSQFHETDCILAYNLDDMTFSHKIMLSEPIDRIQGAEYYDGLLYMSYDVAGSATEKVQTVDVKTGEVETLFERTVSGRDHEAEGLTVYPMDDGSFIHVADYDKLISVTIRHYSLVEE